MHNNFVDCLSHVSMRQLWRQFVKIGRQFRRRLAIICFLCMGKTALQSIQSVGNSIATLQYFRVVVVTVGVGGVLLQQFFKPLQRQLQLIGAGIFLRDAVDTKVIRGIRGVHLLQLFKP